MTDDVFEMETPEDTEVSGNFLKAEGTYHLIVLNVDTKPIRKGKLMLGFEVKLGVLGGTVDGQKGKEIDLLFFNPSFDSTDKQQAGNKRDQFRFWLAIGLVDKTSKKVSASTNAARGRHCVIKLSLYNDFLKASFGEIYHIDDSEVASVPKNTAAIDVLPKEWRRIGAQPVAGKVKDAAYVEPAATGAAVNVDDL